MLAYIHTLRFYQDRAAKYGAVPPATAVPPPPLPPPAPPRAPPRAAPAMLPSAPPAVVPSVPSSVVPSTPTVPDIMLVTGLKPIPRSYRKPPAQTPASSSQASFGETCISFNMCIYIYIYINIPTPPREETLLTRSVP